MAALDYAALIDHLDEQHRRPPALVTDSWLEAGGDGLLARTGFAPGAGLGVKLASVFPRNTDRPTVHSLYALFDPVTGEELAVIGGNAITWFKTACDSGLATRRLARADSRRLLMVGAGAMAPHLVRAHLAARPTIEDVTVWNRTQARAHSLAAALDELDVAVTSDLPTAVAAADVISVATMTVEPIVRGAWVRPGTHVDLVGAYRPDMREADDDLLVRARVFVDSRETTMAENGELAIPLAAGVITTDDVLGDHYELATGAVAGRVSDDDVTVFKNGGGGHLDLMTAQFVLDRV
jgi:alanine dehydrogenase